MTDAQKFEGKWVLENVNKDEVPVLVVDRYGLRILWGVHDDGTLHLLSSPPHLTGETLTHLRELTENVWQCLDCEHWAKGEGNCPWCGEGHESPEELFETQT